MKKVTYTTANELECLKYLSKCYDFALSLCITLALSELDTAVVMLREERMFRQEMKRYVNNTLREADKKRMQINNVMSSKGFFETYSDEVIDLANNDVRSFQRALRNVLVKHHIADADLLSQVETARCLIEVCVLDFEQVSKDAMRRFGVNRSEVFEEFNMSKVYYWYEKATELIYTGRGNVTLITPTTSRLWNKFHKKIAEGAYITGCLNAAKAEHPDFMNSVIVASQDHV